MVEIFYLIFQLNGKSGAAGNELQANTNNDISIMK